MPRITPVTIDQTDDNTTATLNGLKAKLGMVPNLFTTFALAPAALNGYLAFSDALTAGRLTARQREIVALVVAQTNACQYCLSAHSMLGKMAGMSPAEIDDARHSKADDPLEHAIAKLAATVTRQRGILTDAEFLAFKASGLDDGLVIEIITNVALNVLTNYTNHIAMTDVDFPAVDVAL